MQNSAKLLFGSRLKSERQRLGFSQAEFATIAGVSKTTQMLYEGDKRTPNADYLATVAAHGVNIQFVVLGGPQTGAREQAIDQQLLEQILAAIEIWAERRDKAVTPALKAELAVLFYLQFCGGGRIDEDLMARHLRLVA